MGPKVKEGLLILLITWSAAVLNVGICVALFGGK